MSHDDSDTGSSIGETLNAENLSRRRLLSLVGSGALAGLAGCGGDGDGGSPTDGATQSPIVETRIVTQEGSEETRVVTRTVEVTEEETPTPAIGEQEPVDPTFDIIGTDVPTDYNAVKDRARRQDFHQLLAAPAAGNHGEFAFGYQDELDGHVVTDIFMEDDNRTLVRKVNTDLEWHDGNALTAEDFKWFRKIQIKSRQIRDQPLRRFEEVRVEDDETFVQVAPEEKNPQFFIATWGNRRPWPHHYREIMEPRWEEIAEVTTADELDSLEEQWSQENMPLGETVGYSLYEVDSVSTNEATFTKYDGHPFADQQNIERVRYTLVGGDSAARQRITNDQVDITDGLAAGNISVPRGTRFPSSYREFTEPGAQMFKWDYSWCGPMSNLHLRRAVSYLIDNPAIAQNAAPSDLSATLTTGMNQNTNEAWFDEEYMNSLIDYGIGPKPEAAAEELRKAGYSKQDDQWVNTDGEVFSPTLLGTPWWTEMHATIQSQMQQFGIDMQLIQPSGFGQYNDQRFTFQDNDWDMITFVHAGPWEHPGRYFEFDWLGGYVVKSRPRNEFGIYCKPETVEIPEEVGATGDNVATKELNIWEAGAKLRELGVSQEERQQLTEDMCWFMNHHAAIHTPLVSQRRYRADFQDFNHEGAEDFTSLTILDNAAITGVPK